MSKNCLITKLKGTVIDDGTFIKLDTLTCDIPSKDWAYEIVGMMNTNDENTITVTGENIQLFYQTGTNTDGSYTYTEINPKTWTFKTNTIFRLLIQANSSGKIEISNRYTIKNFQLIEYFMNDYTYEDIKYNPLVALGTHNISQSYRSRIDLSTEEISNFKDILLIMYSESFYGDIKYLGRCTKLSTLVYFYNKNLYGDLVDFVNEARACGRTNTGDNFVDISAGNGVVTFNGTVLPITGGNGRLKWTETTITFKDETITA